MKSKLLIVLGISFLIEIPVLFATPTPQRVLIIYNANYTIDSDGDGVQDSLEVAQYYAAKRGVPLSNILGVPCSVTDSYTSYQPFHDEMLIPIRNKLAALGPTNIDVILLCYLTPYVVPDSSGFHVVLDNALMGLASMSDTSDQIQFVGNPYYDVAPTFDTSPGRFSHASEKVNGKDMYLVTRLDGPSVNAALEQVDGALYGERYISNQPGYYGGTGYVNSLHGFGVNRYTDATLAADSDVRSGNVYGYSTVDKCIAYTEHYITAAGFPLKWQNSTNNTLIGNANASYSDTPNTPALTAPDALFFGGWYVQEPDPFDLKAGSVYSDLYSFSMQSFRGGGSSSSKALIQGAAVSVGAIFEPYLGGVSLPETFIYYMLNGYTFSEAASLSNPAIGWMNIHIGDPLYAPLKQKTLVHDTQFPVLVNGFPTVTLSSVTTSRVINAMVKDTPEPDVVKVFVDYGTDINYGTTVQSKKGYWRRHAITISGLQLNMTYHYRLRLQDPVGNVTTTGDYIFNTGTNQVLTSIVVKPSNLTIGVRTTQQFTATAFDQSGNLMVPQPNFIWTADAKAGGINRSTGVLASSATAGGPFTITATVGNVSGTTSVTLVPQTMTSLIVTPPLSSLAPNNSVTFSATAYDQFGNMVVPQPVFAWYVSGGGSIDANGVFTAGAVAGGSYSVVATAEGFASIATVNVFSPVPSSISMGLANAVVAVNKTLQLSAVVNDQAGQPLNPQPAMVWSLDFPPDLSVSNTGFFTAGSTVTSFLVYANASGNGPFVQGLMGIAVSSVPVLSFASPAVSVAENAGVLAMPVRRQGSSAGMVSVNYFTSGGSGANYVPTSGTLTWADGDTADKMISITIKDDGLGRPNPAFTVFLVTPQGGVQVGTYSTEIVTVTDVDGANLPGVLQFQSANEGVNKTNGTTTLTVTRTGGSHGAVSVTYQTSNGTALAGSNYTATSGTLNWADGDASTKTIVVPIINAASQQSDLIFTMALSNPVTATLGSIATTTVTIVNDNALLPPVIASGPTANPNPVLLPATTLLSVLASDPNNRALTYTWNVISGPGIVSFNPNGTASANSSVTTFNSIGTFLVRVTVSDGLTSTTGDVTVTVTGISINQPPTVVTPAGASPAPVLGTTTNLSVLGADDGGESNLTYTWTVVPPAGIPPPTFHINGTNAAKNTTATFSAAGVYSFQCTITDVGGLSVSSSVNVTVDANPTSIVIMPTIAVVLNGDNQTFTATGQDQFSNAIQKVSISWSVTGGGNINSTGVFSATTVGGPFTVTASANSFGNGTSNRITAIASVTVSAVPVAPSIYQQPVDQTVPVGQSATFTVQASGTGVLSYLWRKNDVNITPAATMASYTTPATTLADSDEKFSVVVTNDVGSATSNDAILIVSVSAPTVATPASASPNPVAGTTTNLSVLGADDGGESNLTYAWSTIAVVGTPIPTFSINGTNAAKNTIATFSKTSVYTLRCTITNAGGLSTTSVVTVTVNATPTSITIAPANTMVLIGEQQSFTATALDQFSNAMSPNFSWSVTGGGSIDANGLFSATTVGGPFTVEATAGAISASASVTVGGVQLTPPTVVTPANASPNPVTGTAANLSVLGADIGGESNLIYTWAAISSIGTPIPTFSINGTNAAKNTVATFSQAGVYSLRCMIRNADGLSVTSSVDVTVNATLTSITITPTNAVVLNGEQESFTATALDQFLNAMTANFSWSVTGGGSIDANGIFSATIVGGPFTVTAAAGGQSATAMVTVSAVPVAPSIVQQPANQSVVAGQSAVFTVEATGTGVLAYKWRANGIEINGATNAAYTIPATTLGDNGTHYSVVVTNDAGSATSNDALLTVTLTPPTNQAPLVNAGQDQTVFLSAGANLSGTVSDDGLPNPPGVVSLTWTEISGSGACAFANPTAAATHVTFSVAGTYTLRLTANDGTLSSSDDVRIFVNPDGSGSPSSDSSLGSPMATPNPWVKGKFPGSIRFGNLNSGTNIKVFNRAGQKVAELNGSGSVEWNVPDDLASGEYLAVINGESGNKLRIVIVK